MKKVAFVYPSEIKINGLYVVIFYITKMSERKWETLFCPISWNYEKKIHLIYGKEDQ